MSPGASGRKTSSENDAGPGPAKAAAPSVPADKIDEQLDDKRPVLPNFKLASRAMTDIAGFLQQIEEGDGAELEIEAEFRRKLHGIRQLPRSLRAGARREAREWRRAALKALREKRHVERVARRDMRQLKLRLPFRLSV